MEKFSEAFAKLTDKLIGWVESLIRLLPNIVLAVLIMLVVMFIVRLSKRYANRFLKKFVHNPTVRDVLTNILTVVIVMLGLFLVLQVLHLDTALTSLLAGAGVVGLAIGLALQDPIINVFSGIVLSVRQFFNIHDLVKTNDYFGTIEEITLRTTVIRTLSGERVTIPNKDVMQNPLTNYTVGKERRVEIDCGVSYGDDLQKAKEVAISAINEKVSYDKSKEVELFYKEFGSSSINFQLRFWINETKQGEYLQKQSEGIMAIKTAFDENDIMIPFPIRTLDFGIRGGEKLSEMMGNDDGE